MPGLMDALLQAGLVTPAQHHKKMEAEKSKISRHVAGIAGSVKTTMEGVSRCGSVGEFRDTARQLLLGNPEMIGKVIQDAHRFKGEPGAKELVWLLYQLRDNLRTVQPEQRNQLINRALRRAERTLQAPQTPE